MAVDASGRFVAGRVPAPAVTTSTPPLVTDASATLAGSSIRRTRCSAPAHSNTARAEWARLTTSRSHAPRRCRRRAAALRRCPRSCRGCARTRLPLPRARHKPVRDDDGRRRGVHHRGLLESGDRPPAPVDHGHARKRPAAHVPCGYGQRGTADVRVAARSDPDRWGHRLDLLGQRPGHRPSPPMPGPATNGGGSATASSAFVTIPVGGVPASAGETAVGMAVFKSGRASVPITCSAQASGGCEVALRLTAVETLSGGRVVAVAAHAQRSAHGSAAALRHLTVTLASVHTHIAPGAHTTVVAPLDATGRRLLASKHRLPRTVRDRHGDRRDRSAARPTAHHARQILARRVRPCGALRDRGERIAGACEGPGGDPVHGLGHVPGLRRLLQRGDAAATGERADLAGPRAPRLPLRVAGRRPAAWDAQRGEKSPSAPAEADGLAWLTHTLHAAGFLVGLYTDAGPNGCGGAGQGSYGHYQQDVNTFAAWGFDAVKVDFSAAPNTTSNRGRVLRVPRGDRGELEPPADVLSICDFLQPEQYGEGRPPLGESAFSSYSFGPSVGNSWRTDTDVGFPGNVPFADCRATSTPMRQRRRRRGRATERPRLPRPRPGHVRRPVPHAAEHVVDARGAADDQLQPHQDQPRGPRGRAEQRSDRHRPGPRRRARHAAVLLGQRRGVGEAARRRLAGGRAAEPRLERQADRDERERRGASGGAELCGAQCVDARLELDRGRDQRGGAGRQHGAVAGVGAVGPWLARRLGDRVGISPSSSALGSEARPCSSMRDAGSAAQASTRQEPRRSNCVGYEAGRQGHSSPPRSAPCGVYRPER